MLTKYYAPTITVVSEDTYSVTLRSGRVEINTATSMLKALAP